MKFDINKCRTREIVMHCPTEESAEIFTRYLDSIGRAWKGGQSYIGKTNWERYGEDTCYWFDDNTYSDLAYFIGHQFEILSFYDFDWDELCPQDLAPEMTFDEMFFGLTNSQ